MKKRGIINQQARAQVSLEFLMVVGFAFLLTIPLIILFYQQTDNINTEVTASQVDKIASEIRDAGDEVYYLGTPSKKTIIVYMPDNVKGISFQDNAIVFTVESSSGDYELVKWLAANITDDSALLYNEGIHRISIESVETFESSEVKISE
ncbi:hypothetical protein JW756_04650 [Candidatus Woesearchaeota archaeon]|nr:hypothetical protein [Candidatus Woesearchaeota archaeon]